MNADYTFRRGTVEAILNRLRPPKPDDTVS